MVSSVPAPPAIGVEELLHLDVDHLVEVLALLHETAEMCRRSAEMLGTRAAEERARGYFACFEECARQALRFARICQANQLAALWVAAIRFETPDPSLAVARRPTVSVQTACRIAAVTRGTLLNWMAEGRVEFVRTATGALRIFVDTLYKSGGQA